MESAGALSCLNEVDLFCLHSVFLPRINSTLDSFVESWNNHPISTEQNMTPNQLFIEGALRQNITPTLHTPTCSTAVSIPSSHSAVAVPRSEFVPCDHLQHELDRYNMLSINEDFGYSLYQQVCSLVGRHLQYCNNCN